MVRAPESASTVDAADPFRSAEAALWAAYGLMPEERWVEVHDPRTRIRLQEAGSGDPVVVIGGTGGTGAAWAPLVRELPGRRCIVLDRPGWGLSTPVYYRADALGSMAVRIIGAVLDELQLSRVDLVGGSIGAIWALHAARALGDRIGRLVLIGGMPNPDVPLPTFIKLLRSPIGALMVRMPMKEGMLRKQLAALGHAGTVERGAMDDYIAWRLAFQGGTQSMRHERDMVRAITTSSGFRPGVTLEPAALSALDQPALMVFGSDDPTGSADLWKRFMATFRDGRLDVVPEAGHNPSWDRPREVGATVRRFLDQPMRA
jgi:2-hydroxy-6-oxonona-2,4-dienedioate hydrolase